METKLEINCNLELNCVTFLDKDTWESATIESRKTFIVNALIELLECDGRDLITEAVVKNIKIKLDNVKINL